MKAIFSSFTHHRLSGPRTTARRRLHTGRVSAFVTLVFLQACGGFVTSEDKEPGDGDGDVVGDGDGDVIGDGDGDVTGDGDGDVGCTDIYAFGLHVTVVGGALAPAGAPLPPDPQDIAPPATGGYAGVGGSYGAGGYIATGGTLSGTGGEPNEGACYAEVTAVEGPYSEVLDCAAVGDDCSCSGAGERPGDYTVTATLGGLTETQEVTVTSDECHVHGVELTFFE